MNEIKYIPRCAVCTHAERTTIDAKILSQKYTQKALAVEYDISEQSISNHKNKHLLDSSMNVERLELLVQKALAKDLEPDNIGELVRLLDYHDKLTTTRCATCPYKRDAKPIDQAIHDFVSDEDDEKEIFIAPCEYADFKAWQKAMKKG